MIEEETGLPVQYQRLLTRGIKLDDDSARQGNSKTLHEVGIVHRTKFILLHSPIYAKEKDTYDKLKEIEKEIVELEESKTEKLLLDPAVVSEMVTRICCKLDQIDVKGSTTLRSQRKQMLHRAERLEK
jgi:hypothetical protein